MNLPIKLHDWTRTKNNEYKITKVPGGYIYCREEQQVNIANPVFVPDYTNQDMYDMLLKISLIFETLKPTEQNLKYYSAEIKQLLESVKLCSK